MSLSLFGEEASGCGISCMLSFKFDLSSLSSCDVVVGWKLALRSVFLLGEPFILLLVVLESFDSMLLILFVGFTVVFTDCTPL
jgi:hypothetical protein